MTINNREIIIIKYSIEENWLKKIPKTNWLCILVDNDRHRRYLDEVVSKLINNDVCFVCTIGQSCEQNHDLIDEEIVYRKVEIDKLYLPRHDIITTWHTDFEDGIWFAIFAANHDEVLIDKVVIVDMTDGKEIDQINKLIAEFNVTS